MAGVNWNGVPNPPHPPPPPPPYGARPPFGGPGAGGNFWNFLQSWDPNSQHGAAGAGYGVDHAGGPGFPFGPGQFNPWANNGFGGPWGGGGRGRPHGHGHGHSHSHSHSRAERRNRCRGHCADDTPSGDDDEQQEMNAGATLIDVDDVADNATRDPEKADGGEHPDPPEEVPASGPRQRGGRYGRRGGPYGGGFGGHGGRGRHGPRGFGGGFPGHHGPAPAGAPFDFSTLMNTLGNMPFAQNLRSQFENLRAAHGQGPAAGNDNDNDGEEPVFTPPVDIFSTPNEWTLHVALPGAKKEDVSVNWDPEKATLVISGLVYRPGDEAFLSTLLSGERRVGLFERKIKLPPVGENEKEEVDAERITAKLEDGLLVIVVKKLEKDWTEVKKVDIE